MFFYELGGTHGHMLVAGLAEPPLFSCLSRAHRKTDGHANKNYFWWKTIA